MSRSEFDRIARLTARFGLAPPPDLGIGDDAAVLHPRGALVATVDASVEGVHFRRDFAPLDVLCARAIEAAASDVAAMGARFGVAGSGLLLSWSLPAWVDDDAFDALLDGARRTADRLGAQIVGGNLSGGAELALHTTALAGLLGRPILRSGAAPGDRVYVSGPMGAAAVGLRALLAGRGDDPALAPFIRHWLRPRARVDLAQDVSVWGRAAIDVSDGLAQDALHLAHASGVAIELSATHLPLLAGQVEAAQGLGCDARVLALNGGEDYELLVASREPLPTSWTEVGRVIEGEGVWICEEGGARSLWRAEGWDHFRARGVTSR
jgi:thiamine-monophosphate kinase